MAQNASSALSEAVDHTLASAASAQLPETPPAVEARVSRYEGAVVVVSDGVGITVELTEPIRLSAAELSEELSSAATEALREAQALAIAELSSGGPDAAGLQAEFDSLREELMAAYTKELTELDERIKKVADS